MLASSLPMLWPTPTLRPYFFSAGCSSKDLIFEPEKRVMEETFEYLQGKVKLLESQLSTQNAAVAGG